MFIDSNIAPHLAIAVPVDLDGHRSKNHLDLRRQRGLGRTDDNDRPLDGVDFEEFLMIAAF
jgi:hypothetical protein